MKKNELIKTVVMAWLEEKKNYIKTSTYTYYLFEVESYIIPRFENLRIRDLNEKCIQEAVLYWQRQGGKDYAPLKKTTVQNLVMLMKQFVRYEIKE